MQQGRVYDCDTQTSCVHNSVDVQQQLEPQHCSIYICNYNSATTKIWWAMKAAIEKSQQSVTVWRTDYEKCHEMANDKYAASIREFRRKRFD